MKLEYSGDFAEFDCDKCCRQTRVTTKDETLDIYWCAYCGLLHKVEN